MGKIELGLLCSRRREQFKRLAELSDLTQQMTRAADRKDEISLRMLLSMRDEPLRQLREMEDGMHKYLLTLPVDEAIRCRELLDGAEAVDDDEIPLADLTGRCRRLLHSVREMDKRLSIKVGGQRSFYRMFRE